MKFYIYGDRFFGFLYRHEEVTLSLNTGNFLEDKTYLNKKPLKIR